MSHKLTIEIVVPDGNGEPTTAVYVDGVEFKYVTYVGFEVTHDDYMEVSLSTITVHEDLPEEVNQTLAEQIDLMKAFEPWMKRTS